MLDRIFMREIQKEANGDGSRSHRILFSKSLFAVHDYVGRAHVAEAIKEHGRVKAALCVAATMINLAKSRISLDANDILWAHEVLNAWNDDDSGRRNRALVNMEVHPTKLEPAARNLISLTWLIGDAHD